ncbi:hypothetical protein ACFYTQ_13505 [Nocardia sp. NPDC004068]|uniref:hypothetical protein n=1 Tax=Nocardia sp. NPDC004068 TaxID=3364303 RepID=UPI003697FB45
MFAAILALLGGTRGVYALTAIRFLPGSDLDPTGFWRSVKPLILLGAVLAAIMLLGAVLLLLRKQAGQILIAAAGTAYLALSTVFTIIDHRHGGTVHTGVTLNTQLTLIGVVGTVFNIAMLVLVLLPGTSRWLADRPGFPRTPY